MLGVVGAVEEEGRSGASSICGVRPPGAWMLSVGDKNGQQRYGHEPVRQHLEVHDQRRKRFPATKLAVAHALKGKLAIAILYPGGAENGILITQQSASRREESLLSSGK